MWAWVMTTSVTSRTLWPVRCRALSRFAHEPRSYMPASTSTIPSPARSAHALQCGTPGSASGRRSRQIPGSTRSPRPTSRGRVGFRIGGARYRHRDGEEGPPEGTGDGVPRRARQPAGPARLAHPRHAAAVRGGREREHPLARGRVAAGGRVPVRAPGGALGDRRHIPHPQAQRAAGALSLRLAGGAAVHPRHPPHPPGRLVPGDAGAMNIDGFARLLTDYCLDVQPGQQVQVSSSTLAAPLLLALQREILEREAWPLLRAALPGQDENFWRHVQDAHLDAFASAELAEARELDASLRIIATENANALAGIDPALMSRAARARGQLRELVLKRRWAITLWPTAGGAQQAGMGTRDFEDFVTRALFLDRDDPVAAWGELRDFQAGLIERLTPATTIRIEAPGTDLTLDVSGRTWVNSDGKRNMPSGEVFTGPHEHSAEGVVRFTIPSSPSGVDVDDVTLEFREGRVVSAHAERGDAYLQATLETDDGARYLGELGIGTNFGIDRPIGAILFDEKIGGTVHLALGRSYPESGGTNDSVVHWDMICDLRQGGTLSADGETILADGRFVG